jgi:hypothetical protein
MRLALPLAQVLIIFLCPLARGDGKLQKRGTGCDELGNVTSYSIEGGTFDIICNISYVNTQYLHVFYVPTFTACMTACVTWSEATQCEGVQYDYGAVYKEVGHLCYLLWNTTATGNGTSQAQVDVALLRPVPPSVNSF